MRLLPAYTFAPAEFLKCYCLGCYQEATIGRLHRRFGPVDSCPHHDPERTALANAFGKGGGTAVVPSSVPPNVDSVIGGTKVPTHPVPPTRPSPGQKAEVNF